MYYIRASIKKIKIYNMHQGIGAHGALDDPFLSSVIVLFN